MAFVVSSCIGRILDDALVCLETYGLRWLGGDARACELILGVSYLMSAATVSQSFKLLGLSDTEEVKYRNERLSH